MKEFLRKLLGIQTLKLILFNPFSLDTKNLYRSLDKYPVFFIACMKIQDIKIIDTGIVVRKKTEGK